MAFGKRDDADGQRGPVGDVVGKPVRAILPDLDDGDLRRSAADIEQHDGTRFTADEGGAARNRKAGFRLAADDFEFKPRFPRNTRQKLLAIRRSAAASVAMSRMRRIGRPESFAAQTLSASTARSIASSESRPLDTSPSPSRTMRENASTTRNWPGRVGCAISRRQLLVPRSSAAYISAGASGPCSCCRPG